MTNAAIDKNYQKTLLGVDAVTGETKPILLDNASQRVLMSSTVAPDSGSGITQINGEAGTSQTLTTGTSGTDFAISSASNTHTFNIPDASASARGLLTSADWSTFNNKQDSLTSGDGVDITGGTISADYSTFDSSQIDASDITFSDLNFTNITDTQVGKIDHDKLLNYSANEHFTQASITTVGTVTSGTWSATAIGETKGGTGLTSYTKGDILYSDASNSLAKLGIGTNGQVLKTGSTGVPEWGDETAVASASDSTEGVVELATNAETEAKTDATRAITPSSLGSIFLDEDDMASDSATKLASQQSIKAYVDSGSNSTSYQATLANVANTTAQTTFLSFSIPGGAISDGDFIEIKLAVLSKNNSGGTINYSLSVDYGGDSDTVITASSQVDNAAEGRAIYKLGAQRVGSDLWIVSKDSTGKILSAFGSENLFFIDATDAGAGGILTNPGFSTTKTFSMKMTFDTASIDTYFKPQAAIVTHFKN